MFPHISKAFDLKTPSPASVDTLTGSVSTFPASVGTLPRSAGTCSEANRQKGTLQIKVQVEKPDTFMTPELSAKVDFIRSDTAAK